MKYSLSVELQGILILQHMKTSHMRDISILPVSLHGCGAPIFALVEFPKLRKTTKYIETIIYQPIILLFHAIL